MRYDFYVEEYPLVRLIKPTFSFRIFIRDPCVDLDETEQPVFCQAKDYIVSKQPVWFKELNDLTIAFRQNITI